MTPRIATNATNIVSASLDVIPASENIEHAGEFGVLPDPQLHKLESSGDMGAMIAALLLEASKSSRELARSAREAALAAEDAAFAQKISHMKDAAENRLIGGLASGGLTIASGATAAGGEIGRNDPVAKCGKSLEGGATTANAVGSFLATESDLEKEHAERAMTQAKRNIESAGDADKDAKDLLRRAMSHYAEYVRAKDDASKAALFRA